MKIIILNLNEFKNIQKYPQNTYIAITSPENNIESNNKNVIIEDKGGTFNKTKELLSDNSVDYLFISTSVAALNEDQALINANLFKLLDEMKIGYAKLNLNRIKQENKNTEEIKEKKEEPEVLDINTQEEKEDIDYYKLADSDYEKDVEIEHNEEPDNNKNKTSRKRRFNLFNRGRDAPVKEEVKEEVNQDKEEKTEEIKEPKENIEKETSFDEQAEHDKLNELTPYRTKYEDLDSTEKNKYNQYKTQIEERKKAKKLSSALEDNQNTEEFFIFNDSDIADYKTINHREINLRKKLSAFIPEMDTCSDKTFDEIIELIYFNPTLSEFLTSYKNKYSRDLSDEAFDANTYKSMYIAVNQFIKLCSVIHLEI